MLTVRREAPSRAIESLQNQSRTRSAEPRATSLWIACTDVVMERGLERVRDVEAPLILRSYGGALSDDAALHGGELAAIEYAVEQLGVHDVVVCGHSMCSGIPAECNTNRPSPNGSDTLLNRVRRREAMNNRGREFVIEQVSMLDNLPSVVRAIGQRQLRVHGVFYLVESGLFTLYDRGSGKFLPLYI